MDEDKQGELAAIAAAQRGEQWAWRFLIEQNQTRLFHFVVKMVRDEEEALDIVQESFIKVFRNIDKYLPKAKFSTWLYKIALNSVRDFKKSGHSRHSSDSEFQENFDIHFGRHSTSMDPDRRAIEKDFLHQLEVALSALKENLRITLVLFYFEEMKIDDIAKVLGISGHTVKVRLRNGRNFLRKKFPDLDIFLS